MAINFTGWFMGFFPGAAWTRRSNFLRLVLEYFRYKFVLDMAIFWVRPSSISCFNFLLSYLKIRIYQRKLQHRFCAVSSTKQAEPIKLITKITKDNLTTPKISIGLGIIYRKSKKNTWPFKIYLLKFYYHQFFLSQMFALQTHSSMSFTPYSTLIAVINRASS